MLCPFCNQDKDKVIDSRSTDGGKCIRRRRECLACKKRFTTYEHIEPTNRLTVVKNDGTRVPYDREKLIDGLQKACYKRPIPVERIQELVEAAEEGLFRKYDREVASIEIGKAVAERLKTLDHVAYVRYASVYKQFRDLDDFLEEVRDVLETSRDVLPGQTELFEG